MYSERMDHSRRLAISRVQESRTGLKGRVRTQGVLVGH
jgi:hypothetical protein